MLINELLNDLEVYDNEPEVFTEPEVREIEDLENDKIEAEFVKALKVLEEQSLLEFLDENDMY